MDYFAKGAINGLANAAVSTPSSLTVSGTGLLRFSASGGGNTDLAWLNQLDPDRGNESPSSPPPKDPQRNRRLGIIIIVSVLLIGCAAVFGLALYIAFISSNNGVASPQSDITCKELIDRAMQASGDYCNQIGSNEVCYGNNTLSAELNSGEIAQFADEGDVVSVADLRRLAASPLNLASEEWGIAVFKVLANLPRSLPGETITMVVFGNTTLDNPSNNLQTFYFSSTLGQIQCDEVPFDGLMITMPDGAGVSFVINGAEMMLMGNASISATQNGSMEVSMYSGSAYISANGESQFVTAGQSTSMDLGGPNGTSAVSPPSPPQPLSPEELALACTMTGQFCSQLEITPVSQGDAVATLLAQLGVTPNPTATLASSPTLESSFTPSTTLSPTPSLSATITRTGTLTRTMTPTPTRTRTPTRTSTGTISATPSVTNTVAGPTFTFTPTFTNTATDTPTNTATHTPTNTATNTPTNTATNTPTNTPSGPVACNPGSQVASGSLQFGTGGDSDTISIDLTNNNGSLIRLDELTITWYEDTGSREIDYIDLGANTIWNGNDSNSPTNLPTDFSWTGGLGLRQISSGNTRNLLINFDPNTDLITTEPYSIHIVFDINCYINASIP